MPLSRMFSRPVSSWLKPAREFQQGGDSPVRGDRTDCGLDDAGDEAQGGTFARAVGSDDTDGFATCDGEADILEGGETLTVQGILEVRRQMEQAALVRRSRGCGLETSW